MYQFCNVGNIEGLEQHEGENRHRFWTDGDDILCTTKEAAESVANFLEDIGFDQLMTGYYDPDEDSRNGKLMDTLAIGTSV